MITYHCVIFVSVKKRSFIPNFKENDVNIGEEVIIMLINGSRSAANSLTSTHSSFQMHPYAA